MTPRPSPRFWMRGWTHVLLIKILNKFRYHVFPIKIPLGEALVTPMCVKNKTRGRAALGERGGRRKEGLSASAAGIFCWSCWHSPVCAVPWAPRPGFCHPVGDELSAVCLGDQRWPEQPLTAVDLGITALSPAFPGACCALQIIPIPPPFGSVTSLRILIKCPSV